MCCRVKRGWFDVREFRVDRMWFDVREFRVCVIVNWDLASCVQVVTVNSREYRSVGCWVRFS